MFEPSIFDGGELAYDMDGPDLILTAGAGAGILTSACHVHAAYPPCFYSSFYFLVTQFYVTLCDITRSRSWRGADGVVINPFLY